MDTRASHDDDVSMTEAKKTLSLSFLGNRLRLRITAIQGPQNQNETLSLQDLTWRYYSKRGFFAPTPKEYHFLYTLPHPEADIRLIENVDEFVLQQVVYGDEEIILELISSDPTIVEHKGTVKDYSDRVVDNATPFQAALRAGDEIMAQKIKEIYLASAADGETKQKKQQQLDEQFNAVFPHGYAAHLEEQKLSADKFEHEYLNPLVAAFDDATIDELQAILEKRDNSSKLSQKLNEFKAAFHQLSLSENVYNPNHLLKVFEKYNAKFDAWYNKFKDNNWLHLDLFWRQVIGWEERYMPANYAQAFCTGLGNMVNENKPLQRTLNLHNFDTNRDIHFFPLDGESNSQLGLDFAVYSYGAAVRFALRRVHVGVAVLRPVLQNLCRAKTAVLGELCSANRVIAHPSPGCLIQ